MAEPNTTRINMNLPPEQEAGNYANFAGVWHGADGFVLDFAVVTQPPQPADDVTGQQLTEINARVVSRVRIPTSQAWELMRALNEQLTQWENEHGSASD
ncbi:MAG TPA: DUF3467 domain-containing protein [Jatrophihabitantaceae bacterium]|jgi:hypothetical protein|nr:DUF3467 domain-containing protein [Jatrophihabitantaceae bacterium]